MKKSMYNVMVSSLLAAGLDADQIVDIFSELKEAAKKNQIMGEKKIRNLIGSLSVAAQKFAEEKAAELSEFNSEEVFKNIASLLKKFGAESVLPEIEPVAFETIDKIVNGDDVLKKIGSVIMTINLDEMVARHLPTLLTAFAGKNGIDDESVAQAEAILRALGKDNADQIIKDAVAAANEPEKEEKKETKSKEIEEIDAKIIELDKERKRLEKAKKDAELDGIINEVLGKDRQKKTYSGLVGLAMSVF